MWPMHICRISKRYPPLIGGLENHVRSLSIQQAMGNNQVDTFIMFGDSTQEIESNFRVIKVSGGRLIKWMKSESIISIFCALSFLFKVYRQHKKYPYDVIHIHGDWVEANLARILSRILKVPAIIHVHSGLNKSKLYRFFAKQSFAKVNCVIVQSTDLYDEMTSLGVPKSKIQQLHSGIWRSDFQLRKTTSSTGPLKLIAIGRLHKMKGFNFLINAISQFGRDEVCLDIVGEGPEKADLQATASKSKASIRFLGAIEHSKIANLLSKYDAMVVPSVVLEGQSETTPTVILEAMATGLPIIGSEIAGIKDVVQHHINGFLVPERDTGKLALSIKKLVSNPVLQKQMRKANREASKSFDWSVIVKKVDNAYSIAGVSQNNL